MAIASRGGRRKASDAGAANTEQLGYEESLCILGMAMANSVTGGHGQLSSRPRLILHRAESTNLPNRLDFTHTN